MNTFLTTTNTSNINQLATVCQLKVVAIKSNMILIITSNDEFFTIYNSPTKGICVYDGDTPIDVSIGRFTTLDEAMRFISTY